MSNYSFHIRAKRWVKFMFNCAMEKLHGLDFSMLYVDQERKDSEDYHGYSMTDAGDMKRILKALPIDVTKAAFLDVGCGKGMCMKCAAEVGYKKTDGIDLDPHLLGIARQNMEKLGIPRSVFMPTRWNSRTMPTMTCFISITHLASACSSRSLTE